MYTVYPRKGYLKMNMLLSIIFISISVASLLLSTQVPTNDPSAVFDVLGCVVISIASIATSFYYLKFPNQLHTVSMFSGIIFILSVLSIQALEKFGMTNSFPMAILMAIMIGCYYFLNRHLNNKKDQYRIYNINKG